MSNMTNLYGHFVLDRPLTAEQIAYLEHFLQMKRYIWDEAFIQGFPDPLREAVSLPVGLQGMYFTGCNDQTFDALQPGIIRDYFDPFKVPYEPEEVQQEVKARYPLVLALPRGHAPWGPTADDMGMSGDRVDNWREPVAWLQFLLDHFLLPWGYELKGEVVYKTFEGEEGRFVVRDNRVREVCDRESFWGRPQEDLGDAPVFRDHWIVVGLVSEEALPLLQKTGCLVQECPGDPPVVLVKVTYDANGHKTRGRDDLNLYQSGLIVRSTGLSVEWEESWNEESQGVIGRYIREGGEVWWPLFELLPVSPGFYWLAVGRVTPAACEVLLKANSVLRELHRDPSIILVGLRSDPSYRKQYKKVDVQQERTGRLHVHSSGLSLFLRGGSDTPLGKENVVELTLMLENENDDA